MKALITTIVLFCYSLFLSAQATGTLTLNKKLGKPTPEELSMTVYAPDSSAEAVVLFSETTVDYNWGMDDFKLNYYYKKRIKILKEEGISQADVNIMYVERKDNRTLKEAVQGLEAYAYNMENGKVVRTKMKKEHVFEERINDVYMQLKFSVPQVKVGTVIEYEYQISSDYYNQIRDWFAQENIPVFHTEFNVVIPEYFKFNTSAQGIANLEGNIEETNKTFNIGGQILSCSAEQKHFIGRNLPALKNDNHVWCVDNYAAQVNLELLGYEIPGVVYKNFTQTWEQIDEALLNDGDFGGRTRMSNPLKEEMEALNLSQMSNTDDKISAIFTLLKNKIKWNEKYAFYGKSARQILKDGTGNNADINFILISMLNDAGIQSYPVVMSRRDQRMLPHAHPSLEKLTTFVVGIANTDSTFVFLDASVQDGYLNILPPALLTDRGRLLIPGNSLWVNLQNIGKHSIRRTIQANLQADGTIKGNRITSYYGQHAADIRKAFRTAKDSTDFINQIAAKNDMSVQSYTSKGLSDFSDTVRESITFEKQTTTTGDHIYINPMIFAQYTDNPFKQSERILPVEFAHAETININVMLTLPDGYTIDEIPESTKISTSDGSISMLYIITQQGNKVSIKYTFSISELLYAPDKYEELKKFWELLVEKNNAMMVLKKL